MAKASVGTARLEPTGFRSPRSRRGRHVRKEGQRKRGTTRRSPRRSVHSEGISYKPLSGEIGMCLRVGRMGPQVRIERDRTTRSGAKAPGVERQRPLERRCSSAQRSPAQNGDPTREAGSTKDNGKPSDARRRRTGRPCLIYRPGSRTGENPPYGILGRAMETSASFEARYAPLPYPTNHIDYLRVRVTRAECASNGAYP